MIEILLFVHVLTGIFAIISSFGVLVSFLGKLSKLFWPSIVSVSFSGIGLMFVGASIARVCISGALLTVALVFIHKISTRKLATETINTKHQ